MVIIAASTFSKQKKTVSNLFIRSLAVTDLEVSTVVLPFSITYQILVHWVFWQLLCELWLQKYHINYPIVSVHVALTKGAKYALHTKVSFTSRRTTYIS